jgi:hypothetical protein
MVYPGFAKLTIGVTQQIGAHASAFVTGQNLLNNEAHEFYNFYPVTGRIVSIGTRFQY